MRRSSAVARVLTSLIALVITPTALVLLPLGGRDITRATFSYGNDGLDFAALAGPLLLQALAVVLLMLVVLTGVWSSAGLITAGVMGVVPLVLTMIPSVMAEVIRIFPLEWSDGMIYGIPLSVLPVLGAMGLVLALVRRRPEPKSAALGAVGILVAPLLLAGGGFLLLWTTGRGVLATFQRLEFDLVPDAVLAALGGVILVMLGIAVTRWSPYALLLPALVLLFASVLGLVDRPSLFQMTMWAPREVGSPLQLLLMLGGGAAVAMLYLTFTAVLLRVRSQARLAAPPQSGGPGYPVTAYPVPQPGYPQGYPQQTGYPQQPPASYFPPSGMGPAMHQPVIPPYPPQPGS